MNPYEQKLEARRARLEAAAARAAAASDAAYTAARAATAGIEVGQPILVGHHSEKRHRRDIARSDKKMAQSVALSRTAADLLRQAEAVGTAGISSDDPEAVAKLDDKRTDLERERDAMKSANAYYKRHKTLDGWNGPDDVRREGESVLRVQAFYGVPFPPYTLTNIGARIRQAAKRAATVSAVREAPPLDATANGCTITARPDENRVTLAFPSRLDRDAYGAVRAAGFLWSPTRNAFVRKYGNGAWHAAHQLAKQFGTTE